MKYRAEAPPILTTQIPRKCLGKGVANRVRMAEPFTFDDFDVVISWSVNCYNRANHLGNPAVPDTKR